MQVSNHQSFTYAFFGDEERAAGCVHKLIEHGFDTDHIGVLMREQEGVRDVPLEHKTGIRKGAALGSVLGVAAGAAVLPAAGVIALGGAFAALGGAAVGGAAGTLMGGLAGLGVWQEQLGVPHAAFERGGVLVGALSAPARADLVRSVLEEAGAREIKLATQAEAKEDLASMKLTPEHHATREIVPDTLARNLFLLMFAGALAVMFSIWLFIRPL